jgi:hypothetical protein
VDEDEYIPPAEPAFEQPVIEQPVTNYDPGPVYVESAPMPDTFSSDETTFDTNSYAPPATDYVDQTQVLQDDFYNNSTVDLYDTPRDIDEGNTSYYGPDPTFLQQTYDPEPERVPQQEYAPQPDPEPVQLDPGNLDGDSLELSEAANNDVAQDTQDTTQNLTAETDEDSEYETDTSLQSTGQGQDTSIANGAYDTGLDLQESEDTGGGDTGAGGDSWQPQYDDGGQSIAPTTGGQGVDDDSVNDQNGDNEFGTGNDASTSGAVVQGGDEWESDDTPVDPAGGATDVDDGEPPVYTADGESDATSVGSGDNAVVTENDTFANGAVEQGGDALESGGEAAVEEQPTSADVVTPAQLDSAGVDEDLSGVTVTANAVTQMGTELIDTESEVTEPISTESVDTGWENGTTTMQNDGPGDNAEDVDDRSVVTPIGGGDADSCEEQVISSSITESGAINPANEDESGVTDVGTLNANQTIVADEGTEEEVGPETVSIVDEAIATDQTTVVPVATDESTEVPGWGSGDSRGEDEETPVSDMVFEDAVDDSTRVGIESMSQPVVVDGGGTSGPVSLQDESKETSVDEVKLESSSDESEVTGSTTPVMTNVEEPETVTDGDSGAGPAVVEDATLGAVDDAGGTSEPVSLQDKSVETSIDDVKVASSPDESENTDSTAPTPTNLMDAAPVTNGDSGAGPAVVEDPTLSAVDDAGGTSEAVSLQDDSGVTSVDELKVKSSLDESEDTSSITPVMPDVEESETVSEGDSGSGTAVVEILPDPTLDAGDETGDVGTDSAAILNGGGAEYEFISDGADGAESDVCNETWEGSGGDERSVDEARETESGDGVGGSNEEGRGGDPGVSIIDSDSRDQPIEDEVEGGAKDESETASDVKDAEEPVDADPPLTPMTPDSLVNGLANDEGVGDSNNVVSPADQGANSQSGVLGELQEGTGTGTGSATESVDVGPLEYMPPDGAPTSEPIEPLVGEVQVDDGGNAEDHVERIEDGPKEPESKSSEGLSGIDGEPNEELKVGILEKNAATGDEIPAAVAEAGIVGAGLAGVTATAQAKEGGEQEGASKATKGKKAEKKLTPEQQTLNALYEAKQGNKEHEDLEKEYNELRRKRMGQSLENYVYKRDVRHEFEFTETRDEKDRVIRISARNAIDPADESGQRQFPLRNPDTVINWRRSDVGGDLDEKARSISKGTGDDAGHLIALEFGADPKHAENISNQNFVQNQAKGTYRDFENAAARIAKGGANFGVQVDLHINPDQPDRAIGRTVSTFELDADGRPIVGTEGEVRYLNTKLQGNRTEARADQKEVRAEREAAEEIVRNWTPEQRRAYMRQATAEISQKAKNEENPDDAKP